MPQGDAKARDRNMARERMRRLRANGITVHDRAYNYGLLMLRRKYDAEFQELRSEYLRGHDE